MENKMENFYGTQMVNAQAMNRLDYNNLRGWDLPIDENGEDEGYLILKGGEPNTDEFAGYVAWTTKEQFEKDYNASGSMTFGEALVAMKSGYRVSRSGWNGKGMSLFLVQGSTFKVNRPPLLCIYPEGTEVKYHAHIDMKTADDMVVPWLCSQTDALAEDWGIVV